MPAFLEKKPGLLWNLEYAVRVNSWIKTDDIIHAIINYKDDKQIQIEYQGRILNFWYWQSFDCESIYDSDFNFTTYYVIFKR